MPNEMHSYGHLKPPPHFFEFKLAHLLTILLLAGLVASWWIKHETASAEVAATAKALAEQHERRFLQDDLRFQNLESRMDKMQSEVVPDVREIKTKLNIMVELLDGGHQRPELHK